MSITRTNRINHMDLFSINHSFALIIKNTSPLCSHGN